MQKTVLVTGAAGFIGLNVVKEYIKHDWMVYALIHNRMPEELAQLENVEIIKGDVTDETFMMRFNQQVDVVAHVAGIAKDIGSDEKFRKINFEPIKYLSKIPREKLVYVSSSDVYGIKDFESADENTPMVEFPKNPYPRYKILSEKWLRENCDNYVIIRPAAVWGKGDLTLESRVIEFLRTSPYIVHFGKWRGKCRWPLANVKNVAKTIVSVSTYNDFDKQAITIIDPEKTTIDEYYRSVAKKYFPEKEFKTICLPLWTGKLIGLVSTIVSNTLKLKNPIWDPTFYAVHHVSSNLDFTCDKMLSAIEKLEKEQQKVGL